MSGLSRIKQELIDAIPAFIFFIITFNLIAYSENLMLHGREYTWTTFFSATIGALVLCKVLIIVNTFSTINAFPKKPLIYNIIWKTVIYISAIFLFRLFDHYIHALIHTRSFDLASAHVAFIVTTRIFWAIQLWILMLIIVYVVAAEFVRILGKERVKEMVFGS